MGSGDVVSTNMGFEFYGAASAGRGRAGFGACGILGSLILLGVLPCQNHHFYPNLWLKIQASNNAGHLPTLVL